MKFLQALLLCLWLRSTSATPLWPMCACTQEPTMLHSIFLQPKNIVWPGKCFRLAVAHIPGTRWSVLLNNGQRMFALTKSMEINPCKNIVNDDNYEGCPRIISRAEWGARGPKKRKNLSIPVEYAVIHHSDTPECGSKTECSKRIRSIQNYHMNDKGWDDIAYNFLVGGDGNVYEGRGWDTTGAHTLGYNSVSIGICAIGTYSSIKPSTKVQESLKSILNCLSQKKKVKTDYKLRGHRDLRSTTCPGQMLYNIIQQWPHYRERIRTGGAQIQFNYSL